MAGNDGYTKLLLHCNGADESVSFPDDSFAAPTHIITAQGNAQVDTAQKVFGTGSALLDGVGDYLSIPDHIDWAFGDGNFTVDFWVRFKSFPTYSNFYGQHVDSENFITLYTREVDKRILFNVKEGNVSKGYYYSGNLGLVVDTWYHVALVRSGSNVYLFVDGVSKSLTEATAITTQPNLAANLGVGYTGYVSDHLDGWIDEFRVSKGIARWTANFDVPTEEYSVPPAAYPTARLNKNRISGYHCFMDAYLRAKRTGFPPLKLPDGTIF